MRTGKRIQTILSATGKILFTLVFIAPFYISFVYAVKTKQEVAFTGLAFPTAFHWENFARAVKVSNFFTALKNTVITTVVGTAILTIICSMASYIIARRKTKLYNAAYYFFLGTILIPFQAMMFPLYLMMKKAGMLNTLLGFTLAKVGAQTGFCILVMTGFVKNIPIDMEEAAYIDGCGRYRSFFSIVFQLMRPIIVSTVVINALSIWNEFSMSMVLLQRNEVANIPLMTFYFFGENVVELNLAFAVFTLSMIPILLLYLLAQKQIISGIMMGAVKG